MSLFPLDMKGYPYRNIDEAVSNKGAFRLYDGYCDEALADHVRPGHSVFVDLGTGLPMQGQHYWSEKDLVVAISNGRIFLVASSGLVTDVTGDSLTNTINHTVFASYGVGFFVASGGKMVRYTGAGTTSFIADPDAPINVTHVAYIDGYILATSLGTQQVFYSDPVVVTTWPAFFFSAEGKPDLISALFVKESNIVIFGRDTVEYWYNDGTTPFVRQPGASGVIESGCIAPYSVVWSDAFSWMDTKRQIVVIQGRTVQPISDPIQADLDVLTNPSDCIGFVTKINGNPFLIFSFPTDQRTFVFDIKQKGWAEWSRYNTTTGQRENFFGNCSCLTVTFGGKQLIGSRLDSKIYVQDASLYQDDGETIKWEKISSILNHGNYGKKNFKSMRFVCKRGSIPAATAPVFTYAFRDDGNKTWSNEYEIDLGLTGDYFLFKDLYRMGQAQARQHRIYHTDNSPFVLVDIEIDVEALKG